MSTVRRKHYSRDLKERVIYQHEKLGYSAPEIAVSLDMSLRVVQRTIQVWKEIGNVVQDSKAVQKGRPRLLNTQCVEFILALLDRHPDIYLDEILEQLADQLDITVSLATIHRTLKVLGVTSKKLSRTAAERSETMRALYWAKIANEPMERLVFVDESSINMLTANRVKGRSFKGQRARIASYFQRGDRFSILPALTKDGILYADIVRGSFNGATFQLFVKGLLQCMNPYPNPRSVLVMDNCAIHHVEGVEEMCQERGIKLIYLPPYSPDFNPIEECFSFVKAYIRRHHVEFRTEVQSGEDHRAFMFLHDVLYHVPSQSAVGWFKDCNYYM